MTDDESQQAVGPRPIAEQLLRWAETRRNERARLIERWSRAEAWSLAEGIALAWTLDPAATETAEILHRKPDGELSEGAQHYLELARRSYLLSGQRVTPARFMEWAHLVGLAFHQEWHDAVHRAAADVRVSQAQAEARRRQPLIRHWARAPYWQPEEGVALACGLDPENAIIHSTTGYAHPTIRGSDDGNHLLKLAYRAIEVGSLGANPHPIDFMTWARSVGVEFDEDWWAKVADPLVTAVEAPDVPPPVPPASELKTREKESLLKMVIGMAIGGYGWDPRSSRNSATAEIATDLETSGVGLDTDTILKWLRQGAELLPGGDA